MTLSSFIKRLFTKERFLQSTFNRSYDVKCVSYLFKVCISPFVAACINSVALFALKFSQNRDMFICDTVVTIYQNFLRKVFILNYFMISARILNLLCKYIFFKLIITTCTMDKKTFAINLQCSLIIISPFFFSLLFRFYNSLTII